MRQNRRRFLTPRSQSPLTEINCKSSICRKPADTSCRNAGKLARPASGRLSAQAPLALDNISTLSPRWCSLQSPHVRFSLIVCILVPQRRRHGAASTQTERRRHSMCMNEPANRHTPVLQHGDDGGDEEQRQHDEPGPITPFLFTFAVLT